MAASNSSLVSANLCAEGRGRAVCVCVCVCVHVCVCVLPHAYHVQDLHKEHTRNAHDPTIMRTSRTYNTNPCITAPPYL